MDPENRKLIVQTLKKLSIACDTELIDRSVEFLRLVQLKSSAAVIANENAKTIICIHLATDMVGTPVTATEFITHSGLQKTKYERTKRTLEKILDLNRVPGINQMCVQLGLNEVKAAAETCLARYQKFAGSDLSHPQYAAMAIFLACKKTNTKPPKQKLVTFSQIKPGQWLQLEKQFVKAIGMSETEVKEKKFAEPMEGVEETKVKRGPTKKLEDDVEDYETWKARILKKAYRDLEIELLQKEKKLLETEYS